MQALRRHMAAVEAHPLLAGRDIDFKLAEGGSCGHSRVCHETGFDSLSVRFCKVRLAVISSSLLLMVLTTELMVLTTELMVLTTELMVLTTELMVLTTDLA